jgi:hypothetical protein
MIIGQQQADSVRLGIAAGGHHYRRSGLASGRISQQAAASKGSPSKSVASYAGYTVTRIHAECHAQEGLRQKPTTTGRAGGGRNLGCGPVLPLCYAVGITIRLIGSIDPPIPRTNRPVAVAPFRSPSRVRGATGRNIEVINLLSPEDSVGNALHHNAPETSSSDCWRGADGRPSMASR